MKTYRDEGVAEVRAARKALCDRFANDPTRLLAHLRERQRHYSGKIIKHWPEVEPVAALRETPPNRRKKSK